MEKLDPLPRLDSIQPPDSIDSPERIAESIARKEMETQLRREQLQRPANNIAPPLLPRRGTVVQNQQLDTPIITRRKEPFRFTDPNEGTASAPKPFKLSASRTATGAEWTVSSNLSTITDGTNGAAIDLTTVGFDIANDAALAGGSTLYVSLSADVAADLTVTNWLLEATTAAPQEVTMASGAQSKITLYIGSVEADGNNAIVKNAVHTAQIITHMFLNGALVKGFCAGPVHTSG